MVALAEQAEQLTQEVTEAEAALKARQTTLRTLVEEQLPGAMEAANMTTLTLGSGTGVALKAIVAASISKAHQGEAFALLRKGGNDGLIKSKVTVLFGKGQSEQVTRVVAQLQAKGYDYSMEESVHASTLAAWVRERKTQGHRFSDQEKELLGIYMATRAIVTLHVPEE